MHASVLLPWAAALLPSTVLADGSVDSDLVVDLGYASFQGVANATTKVNSWFGIRYAKSPTGTLRWRPPVPIENSKLYTNQTLPLDATNTGPICPQGYPGWRFNSTPGSNTIVQGSEDCLLLDVLAPANPVAAKLPVLVQIHGGGFAQGWAEQSPGYGVVGASKGGLVYVTLQYRLGAYGFLGSAAVKKDGTANAGLLDQRAALWWVQKHIAAFGGDPARVTLVGGSAGGASVMAQMIMYGGEANPPFRAAIAEYPWWQTFHDTNILEIQLRQMLHASGCDSLACMRRLGEDQLLKAQEDAYLAAYPQYHGQGDFYFGPSVDGDIIRALPSQEFKQGHFTKVPLVTVHSAYEGYGYSNKSLMSSAGAQGVPLVSADITNLYPAATQSFLTRLFQLYPASAYNSSFWQRSAMFSDAVVNCPSYLMASTVADHATTFKMIFAAGSQTHGANSPFLWEYGYGKQAGQNATLANILKDYYVSFAIHLDPNRESYTGTPKPRWGQYMDAEKHTFTVLQVNQTEMAGRDDPDASAQCDFWLGNSRIVRN